MMRTWFADDAAVGGRPGRSTTATRRVLEEVLPARREAWTERLLLLALWLRAGPEDVISGERWKDYVVLAHEQPMFLSNCLQPG
jgi:hypothetical protein